MRNKFMLSAAAVCLLTTTAAAQGPGSQGTPIKEGEQCPAGMTEIRPRRCLAPQLTAPSILDYRPVSTLIVPAHPVPRAKFPAVDFHGHITGLLLAPGGPDSVIKSLDKLNVRVIVAADGVTGERLVNVMKIINGSPQLKSRISVFTGIDFRNVGPGWADKAIAQLRADAAAGATGVGEVSKQLGLYFKKADGSRLKIDDPELDPIWRECARLGLPVFIHTADPQEFFRDTIDYSNERWLELALFPNRRYPQNEFPSFEQLNRERDNLFRRNPKTTFVIAHMGWHANDLNRLGKLMSELPNLYTEVGAVLYDIGRQPRAAHDFFVKYQDRILFGKDSFQPEEYPYYWRVFETRDDYFDYYRDYHAFWKLYGISLPDAVLKKVYYQNALKITKGLPKAGWPK
jgi:uncharacterized protein